MGPRIAGFLVGSFIAALATQGMLQYDVACKADATDAMVRQVGVKAREMAARLDGMERRTDALEARASAAQKT